MLRELTLAGFKCFEDQTIPIRALTLLSGVNASGKSSVIQALALLRQSVIDAEWSSQLVLDGSLVRLGTVADVIDKVHGGRTLDLGIAGEDWSVRWTFGDPQTRETDAASMPLHRVSWKQNNGVHVFDGATTGIRALVPQTDQLQHHLLVMELLKTIEHVGAERIGPREVYALGRAAFHSSVGVQGERMPGALWLFGDAEVPEPLRHPTETRRTLRAQSAAWLEHFFPGVTFEVQKVPNLNAVTMGFRTSNLTNFHRPQHVGYGITHVLPILIAGLRTQPNQVLLVENPEVHLHPAGQAQIGRFLAQVAAAGRTVLVETHSDHVLNGIRRAVRDGSIPHDDVSMLFFRERALAKRDDVAQVETPRIDREGNLDHWPHGFFDQFDIDINYLVG